MRESRVNSLVFAVEDNLVTTLVFERLQLFGKQELNITDNVYYFSNSKSRIDVLPKRDQIVISLNLDFGQLLEKGKYEEATIISPKSDVNYLKYFNKINLIGFQRHLIPENVLKGVDINSNDNMSLGLLSNNLSLAEPIFRKSDIINFDLSSIKYGDLPVSYNKNVTGLTSEQFVQLVKYSGYSDSLKILNFDFGNEERPELVADLIATSIWYCIESISNDVKEGEQLSTIVINFEETDDYVTIHQNIANGKCYFSIEGDTTQFPCTNEDFILAKERGEFGPRILKKLRGIK